MQQRREEVLSSEQVEALILFIVFSGADGLSARGAAGAQAVHVRVFFLFWLSAAY